MFIRRDFSFWGFILINIDSIDPGGRFGRSWSFVVMGQRQFSARRRILCGSMLPSILQDIGFILIERGDLGPDTFCGNIQSVVVMGQGPRFLVRAWCLRGWLELMRARAEVPFGRLKKRVGC